MADIEKSNLNGNDTKIEDVPRPDDSSLPLKRDKYGLPLIPQPSDHDDDPLVMKHGTNDFLVS